MISDENYNYLWSWGEKGWSGEECEELPLYVPCLWPYDSLTRFTSLDDATSFIPERWTGPREPNSGDSPYEPYPMPWSYECSITTDETAGLTGLTPFEFTVGTGYMPYDKFGELREEFASPKDLFWACFEAGGSCLCGSHGLSIRLSAVDNRSGRKLSFSAWMRPWLRLAARDFA